MTELGVTVAWDSPEGPPQAVLVLAHGAGGDLNDPMLRAVGAGLASRGVAVARFNFPYREAGRRAPGAQSQSEECYKRVADASRRDGLPLFCGGKSYGGRIASHIAAQGFAMSGLVFMSYPLHPPGKTDRLRDAHLKDVRVPMLFLQGTRDPFARRDLLTRTVDALAQARLVSVEGGDHSLRVRGQTAADVSRHLNDEIAAFVVAVRG